MKYIEIQQATGRIEQAYRQSATDLKKIHMRFHNLEKDYKQLDEYLDKVPADLKTKAGQSVENFMKAIDVLDNFIQTVKQAHSKEKSNEKN